jgi:hypothetical protein
MPPIDANAVASVESAINALWKNGIVPSIQGLESTTGLDADTVRQATEELLKQNRISSLPLDQPIKK